MKRIAIGTAAFVLGGAVASLLYFAPGSQSAVPVTVAAAHPVWTETKWPFLMDQWGEGKAFQCKAADCGVELTVYIRSKIGFCSRTTGVADDSELDRLSDFDFMNNATVALGDGHEIDVGWMKGRVRAYTMAAPGRSRTTAMSFAYNNNSDALVATVILNDAQAAAVEPAVLAFLSGKPMLRWVSSSLGL